MWMMPLHLHVNQKSDYDDMMILKSILGIFHAFLLSENQFFSKKSFRNTISDLSFKQIGSRSGPTDRIQTVYKGNQQRTLVGKVLIACSSSLFVY